MLNLLLFITVCWPGVIKISSNLLHMVRSSKLLSSKLLEPAILINLE